jgi:protein-disulfide isomerase
MQFRKAAVAALLLLAPAVGQSQTTATDDSLRRDIEALKEGQKAIQKDLDEIKRLLQGQARAAAADALPAAPISIAGDPVKGDKGARIALIEFSDYQCPFCGRYAKEVMPQLLDDYVKTGKVKYVFQDMPLEFHKNAFKAAEAAHCAGDQGKFWEMHDRLFQNQAELAVELLPAHAKALGLDEAKFQQCLDSGKFAAEIKQDIAQAATAGISGTPSFLLGVVQPGEGRVKVTRKLVGAKPYAEFKAAVDSLLANP